MIHRKLEDQGFHPYHKLENSPLIKFNENLVFIISTDIEGHLLSTSITDELFVTILNKSSFTLMNFFQEKDKEEWNHNSKFIEKFESVNILKFLQSIDEIDHLCKVHYNEKMAYLNIDDNFAILPNFTVSNSGVFNITSHQTHENLNFTNLELINLITNVSTLYTHKELPEVIDFLTSKNKNSVNNFN